MDSATDQQLLRAYTDHCQEPAFTELVRRHVDFVYSAARRMVRDAHLAEDVTQGVFVALAQNTRQLLDGPALEGWLHGTTRNLAANAVRSDVRRRAREQEATIMNELLSASPDASWEHIAPHLDAALGELSEPERDAVLLRYFKNHNLPTVGTTLGISDDAAQKRVSRAVERLREFFVKRGVTAGAGGLAVVISANAVQAAPVGLAFTISTAAVLTGTTLATTATVTAAKAIAMTALQKTIVATTIAVLAGAGIYEARQTAQLRHQVQTLQQQQTPLEEQIKQLQSEREESVRQLAVLNEENTRLNQNTEKLIQLRADISRLRNAASESKDSTELAAKSWLARVNRLKEHMQNNPNARIPECEFLTDQDWLNASNGTLDSDDSLRRAMSSLRQASKNKFVAMTLAALKNFARANTGQFPASLNQLKPFFNPPVDDSILDRYEILPMKDLPIAALSGKWAVAEKAPTDAAYDLRGVIGEQGFLFTDFRTFPIDPELWSPYQAFRTANPGLHPTEPAQLLPYATTTEQQASIQKAIEAFTTKTQP